MIGGHGHVRPRPDGLKARCGGPRICSECARELAAAAIPAAQFGPIDLSPTQIALLDKMREHGNTIIRLPGGFWTGEGVPWVGSAPLWHFGTSTINALIVRGVLIVTERKGDRQFPVRCEIAPVQRATARNPS